MTNSNRSKMVALLVISTALLGAPAAHAEESWPAATTEAATQALADLRARAARAASGDASIEEYARISAAAAVGGGLTYGVGKYAAYRTGLREAALAGKLLEREIVRVNGAVIRALEPEMARFGSALLELQRQRLAQGVGRGITHVTGDFAQQHIMQGLESPAVRERIMRRLTAELGAEAPGAFQKIINGPGRNTISRAFIEALKLDARGLGELASRGLGRSLSEGIARSVAPSTARLTTRAALTRAAAAAAGRGLGARCLGWLGRGLRFAGSAPLLVLTIVLDPSPVAAGTMDAMYADHTDSLLDLPNAEAMHWVERYGNVRRGVIRTRDIAAAMDAEAGDATVTGDVGEMLSCPAEQPSEAVSLRSEAAATPSQPYTPAACDPSITTCPAVAGAGH